MTHEREKIKQLFDRYRQGRCTPEEEARLHAWLNQYVGKEASGLDELHGQYTDNRMFRRKRWLRRIPYAAAVAAVALITFWYIDGDGGVGEPVVETVSVPHDDVAPGGNRAKLTLADGREIFLDELQSGIVMGDERILYKGGDEELANLDREAAAPLVLSTPRGGTYQITLSDGTAVWLNAASTLTYPVRFSGESRVVEIQGEAYFAVAEDSERPFKVISRGQEIEVLGTEFNISAYADETSTTTTLVEGSIRLRSGDKSVSLVPGEQSLLSNDGIRKQSVEVSQYIAWKEGNFHFDNTPLPDMMNQMSRWYDVDVVYENNIPGESFSGTLSRAVTLQTVLELLRISEIKYRIQGSQLIIE